MALRVSNRGYVLVGGQVVLSATAAELASSEHVQAAYLGTAGH